MRQIGIIPDEAAARRLADYLLTLKIDTKLGPRQPGWEVWVCDEDRVAQAKHELAAFLANPTEPRFLDTARAADELRRADARAEAAGRRHEVDLGRRWQTNGARPATVMLALACGLVFILTDGGDPKNSNVQRLTIASYETEGNWIYWPGLSQIGHGQIWRLFTPCLLHFGIGYIAFNLLALSYFGSQIEGRRGSLRFVLLVVVVGVLSNLAQYYWGGVRWESGGINWDSHSPRFGGLSGVVFGLFGYIWMKMRFQPELGLGMTGQTFAMSLAWLAFCFTGLAGPVANLAHFGGLLVGMALGAAPALWRALWRRRGSNP